MTGKKRLNDGTMERMNDGDEDATQRLDEKPKSHFPESTECFPPCRQVEHSTFRLVVQSSFMTTGH